MRAIPLLSFFLLSLLAAPLLAEDGGALDAGPRDAGLGADAGLPPPPPAVPATCGDLDEHGQCFGDVAAFCSQENGMGQARTAPTERIDCAALLGTGGITAGSCLELEGFGAWCGVPPGSTCAFPGEEGLLQMACVDDTGLSTRGACDLVSGCVDDAAPCTADDASFVCVQDRLLLGCAPFGQPRLLGCDALGGRCEAARCVELDRDAPCDGDAAQDGGVLGCERGLRCVGSGGEQLGTCVPEGAPLETARPPDAGPAPPSRPGCSAQDVAPGTAPLGLFGAALGAWLAWGRPRRRYR